MQQNENLQSELRQEIQTVYDDIFVHTLVVEPEIDVPMLVDDLVELFDRYALSVARAELEALAEQYGEFRDETLGKPIDIKAVSLYRIKHRIAALDKEAI